MKKAQYQEAGSTLQRVGTAMLLLLVATSSAICLGEQAMRFSVVCFDKEDITVSENGTNVVSRAEALQRFVSAPTNVLFSGEVAWGRDAVTSASEMILVPSGFAMGARDVPANPRNYERRTVGTKVSVAKLGDSGMKVDFVRVYFTGLSAALKAKPSEFIMPQCITRKESCTIPDFGGVHILAGGWQEDDPTKVCYLFVSMSATKQGMEGVKSAAPNAAD